MDKLLEFLEKLDWSPLWISLKTGVLAAMVSFFLGILAAAKIMKMKPYQKAIADGFLTFPMALPPTVVGFFLLLIFSRKRPFGIFLYQTFHLRVIQSWLGCVVAATVIAFPLMYRNARAAFEQIDENLIYAGQTLGMSERRILWQIAIPTAWPGIAGGAMLAFARALGEYGATSMLAGNIPGKTATISQQIAMVMQNQDYAAAGIWTAVVIVIALAVVFLMNVISYKAMKCRNRW